MATLTTGREAPVFELVGIDGNKYGLNHTLTRTPILLIFFKVSCPTCQFTLPAPASASSPLGLPARNAAGSASASLKLSRVPCQVSPPATSSGPAGDAVTLASIASASTCAPVRASV